MYLHGTGGAIFWEQAGASALVICNGEEKNMAAWEAGYSTLGMLTGEKCPDEAWLQKIIQLAPPRIILANDNDETGAKANASTAAALVQAGYPADQIFIMAWPADATSGFDLNNVLKTGGLEAVRALVEGAEMYRSMPTDTITVAASPALRAAPLLYEPFPLHLLPLELGEWVAKRAAAIPCDPAMIALPVLAMLAAAIGATRRVCLKDSWREPSVIWTAIVGLSGSTKSPALDAALHPIQSIERRAWRDYKREHAAWHEELGEYKNAPKDKRAATPPAAPVPRRYIVSDTTIEALAPLLLDNPRGLLLARDELSGWIAGMSQYKARGRGDDLAKWLELHGARSLRVDRKATDQRFLYVPRAAVSVTGGIQPNILRRVIGAEEKDSGFLARLLLACPPELPKRWTDQDGADGGDSRIQAIVERLLDLEFERDQDGDEKPIDLWLAPDAREPFKNYVNELGETTAGMSDETLRAALAKHEGAAARLALVLHLVELAGAGGPMNAPVTRLAMERGIGLAKWFTAETARIYRILEESNEDREARQVAEAVGGRLGGRATPRELVRSLHRYHGEGGMERAETILKRLAAAGLGEWRERKHGEQGGRPVFELVLNDMPH